MPTARAAKHGRLSMNTYKVFGAFLLLASVAIVLALVILIGNAGHG